MITPADFWKGRDLAFVADKSTRTNATVTLARINALLALALKDGLLCDKCSSGWRPVGINDSTANAAKNSRHIYGQAIDVADPERKLAQWCLMNMDKLDKIGLWMEDPRWTPSWVHLQTVPPKSGKRIFIPNTSQPSAPPLLGQGNIPVSIKI